jgi:hypothetical protein
MAGKNFFGGNELSFEWDIYWYREKKNLYKKKKKNKFSGTTWDLQSLSEVLQSSLPAAFDWQERPAIPWVAS